MIKYCSNLKCPERVIQSLSYYASKECMDMEGLSSEIIRKLYSNGLLIDIKSFYTLHKHILRLMELEGFKEKSINNILKSIADSRENECWRFLKGLGIPLVGETVSIKLCKLFKTHFLDIPKSDLLKIDCIGENIAESYMDAMDRNRDYYKSILPYLNLKYPKEINGKYKGMTICITGTFDISKDKLKDMIRKEGGTLA